MINIKDLSKVIKQVADEKGLDPERVVEAIESALAAAYKKEYGKKGEIIKCKLDLKSGTISFYQIKTVVDENIVYFDEENKKEDLVKFNSEKHILIEEAKKIKSDVVIGEELIFNLPTKEDFGRIAAQVAKQTILQKMREIEQDTILKEWKDKEGSIVSGIIQRFDRGNIYVDLGKAIGIVFPNDSIPGEHYQAGDRMRFLVLAVQKETNYPGIVLSRSHPDFIKKLFEMEVPEITEGIVEIKAIAREPGSRTKIAVASKVEGIDPVGSLVGPRGTRVMVVTNELGLEKIDIIEWSDDPAKFIANSLSPAKITSVEILPKRSAKILVPEDQLSLAIGKGGQNVRLAAKLTNWKMDVRSITRPEEVQEGGVAEAPEIIEENER
ncbi:MAG: transcription termination factor NusA [bacterium]|nr:transcription termination factor NusA [Patescibacteria group bacterium]MDW8279998.1 transcription termination factor NusA [bacterium]